MTFKQMPYLLLFLLAVCLSTPGSGAAVSAPVAPGLNVTAITAPLAANLVSAFPLLTAWKSSGVSAVESYDATGGKMLRAELDGSGDPSGNDFPLVENSALFVYATGIGNVSLGSVASCSPLNLASGFNLAGFACFPGSYLASEFLHSVGLANISSISRLDGYSGRWQTAAVDGGVVVGDDFPLLAGEGYVIHSGAVSGWTSPLPIITGLTPSQLHTSANSAQIEVAGSRFLSDATVTLDGADAATTFVSDALLRAMVPPQSVPGSPAVRVKNPDPHHAGGYFISDPAALAVVYPPIGLTPSTLTVWQGQPGAALTVSVTVPAPSGGTTIELASSDPALVGVSTAVIVPEGATTVAVSLTLPDTGSVAAQPVTVTASNAGMVGAQATLSVRPKPTVNLSPSATVTGLTFSYPLTVTLSEIAPPGGFPVTLEAAPAGIVAVPASVTVAAGAASAQVTVTATALGSAVISAGSPGRGVGGTQHGVTVKAIQSATYSPLATAQVGVQVGPAPTAPTSADASYTPLASAQVGIQVGPVFAGLSPIQTMNYGPLTAYPVGVQVGDNPTAATSVSAAYDLVASVEVGVAVGPVITGVSPNHGAIGDTAITVTVTGYGLDAVTGIAFLPAAGITVGTLAVAPDGLSVTVPIDIAANAAVGARTVLATTAGGSIRPTRGGADVFNVTLPEPEIQSIQPLRAMVGQSVAMTIYGTNFTSASSVNLTPSTGITVSNPPTVNANGTVVTVSFAIAAGATLGDRVVAVTTPGGTTSATASVTNTFSVTSATDPGATHTSLTAEVGVLVQTAVAATTQDVAYGPTSSQPVGVTVGSTIAGIAPVSGNIGSSSLVVRALGAGLNTANAISFQPPDGITVQAGSFAIGGDGNPQVTIDIAADAPVTPRTVLVALSSGGYALPTDAGSNQFLVTLPAPEIFSLQPIRAMVGQVVAMTIIGANFGSAGSVDFTPADGISVVNPPTVSPDGAMITTSFTIAANAAPGNRVVTVTTPGGVTGASASTANSFSVTADQGTTYTPLLSPEVGVLVSTAAGNNQADVAYAPLSSVEVGVMVTPAAAATSENVDYGPLATTELGVAVGGVFTGFSPAVMEPGSSVTFTLTGIGLDSVTAVAIVPSANLTVTAWTPAGDGRSGTVTVTADSGVAPGTRTLAPMVGSTALTPSAAGVDLLRIGYRPVVNSITATFPDSSVLAVTGSTVTLTMNGVNLQGVAKVEVLPADGITIDSAPFWFSDGTGEHVSVMMIIADNAELGDRTVRLTTPYGSSGSTRDNTNTLGIVDTVAGIAPDGADAVEVAAQEAPALFGSNSFSAAGIMESYGLSGRRIEAALLPSPQRISMHTTSHSVAGITRERLIASAELPDASRGPPGGCG